MTEDWQKGQLITMATWISLSVVALGVLWVVFLQEYIITVLTMETVFGRYIGLLSALAVAFIVMAAVMLPITIRSEVLFNRTFGGYQGVKHGIEGLLGETLFGSATYELVRVDGLPMFLGAIGGWGFGAQMARKQQDKVIHQRKNIGCEICGTTHNDTGLDDSVKKPFVYIEKYKQWAVIMPIYSKHLETTAYCQEHTPREYEDYLPEEEKAAPPPEENSYRYQ